MLLTRKNDLSSFSLSSLRTHGLTHPSCVHVGVEKVATYTGVLYASAGLASLFGTPIASAIHNTSGYEPTIVYASVMILAGVLGCIYARLRLSRKLFKVV